MRAGMRDELRYRPTARTRNTELLALLGQRGPSRSSEPPINAATWTYNAFMGVQFEFLAQQLALADQLLAGRQMMLEPQALPGRYGRVVKAVDHLLTAINCPAVLAGGWAVWRHGFVGRVTQDLDIVLPASQLAAFLQAATVSGFSHLPQPPGRWPKLQHKDTGIEVDVLPEGGRPGTTAKPAPTTIPHPGMLGAAGTALRYIDLAHLVELKLAAGRIGDEHDVVELIRANRDQVDALRQHLAAAHADYVTAFDRLLERAREQDEPTSAG